MTISVVLIARAAVPFDLSAGPYPGVPDVPPVPTEPAVPWGGPLVTPVRWGGE
jgi:hypothetical protein